MDTFWYIDPQKGVDGVWDNSLASEKPIYNADFTEMTVKLRKGIFWSDGVEFTADDVRLHHPDPHEDQRPALERAGPGQRRRASRRPIRSTVVFKLKKPNSRFHALFTVRWNAMWMMPKHVFEKAGDPLKFAFNPPVTLGRLHAQFYDPNGKWFIWQKRDDWQRTTRRALRRARPEIRRLYRSRPAGQARDRAAQPRARHHPRHLARGHVHARQAVEDARTAGSRASPTPIPIRRCRRWSSTTRIELFKNRDVRWALALLIDIKAVSMASYRGAATISAIGVPPTGSAPDVLSRAARGLAAGLRDRHRQAQDQAVRSDRSASRSPTCCGPRMGDQIPTDADEIAKSFGRGWWKPNPQAAAELLERAGFTKKGDKWFMPDGKPFAIKLMVEGEGRPVMTRAGSMITQQWRQFGIDASTVVAQGSMADRRAAGDYEAMITWSVETWGGHPDLSFFLDSWHSQFVAAPGKPQPPRNWQRWTQPRARQDHRADPPDRLRRSQGPRARPRLREARGARDADHPADVVQRLHGDGRHLLDRLPERRDRALHRSGAELGQHQVHDGEAEAEAVRLRRRFHR